MTIWTKIARLRKSPAAERSVSSLVVREASTIWEPLPEDIAEWMGMNPLAAPHTQPMTA